MPGRQAGGTTEDDGEEKGWGKRVGCDRRPLSAGGLARLRTSAVEGEAREGGAAGRRGRGEAEGEPPGGSTERCDRGEWDTYGESATPLPPGSGPPAEAHGGMD